MFHRLRTLPRIVFAPLALAALASVAGCDKFEPIYNASAESLGEATLVRVSVEAGTTITIEGETKTASEGEGDLEFWIAFEKFPPGENALPILAERDGKSSESLLRFNVPTTEGLPFLQLYSCPRVPEAEGKAKEGVGLDLRGDFGGLDNCKELEGTLDIVAVANPGATVQIGGQSVTAGPNGEFALPLDVGGDVLGMSPPVGDAEEGKIYMDVKVEKQGQEALTGVILLSTKTRRLVDDFASSFVPGKPLHPKLVASPKGFLLVRENEHRTSVVGELGPLRNVRLIALTEDEDRAKAGSCGPYEDYGSLPRYNVDQELIVYDALTGAELARETFEGKSGSCPSMVTVDLSKENSTTVYPSRSEKVAWLEGQLAAVLP